MTTTKPRSVDEYMIGWICTLPVEWIAASGMLDDIHFSIEKPSNDLNNYNMGSIYGCNVVIACPPNEEIGNNSAATIVAGRMKSTFPQIRIVLLVGIGSGIPSKVSLGDVVVGTSVGKEPGLVQWDTGKVKGNGSFERIGSLNPLPHSLLKSLETTENAHGWLWTSCMNSYFKKLQKKWPELVSRYLRSDSIDDTLILAKADYSDINKSTTCDGDDGEEEKYCRCRGKAMNVKMDHTKGQVHFGMIASGNQVIEDAELRDKLKKDLDGDVLCVETQAAGLAETVPCLVIRGICDYADSHKNKDWHEHAAAMAAAVAKEVVEFLPEEVEQEPLAMDVIDKVFIGSARNDSPQPIAADADRELQKFGLTLSLAQMLQDKQQIDKTQQLRSQKNTQLREIKGWQEKLEVKLRKFEMLKSYMAKEEDKIHGEIHGLQKIQAEAEQCTAMQTQLLKLRQLDGLDHDYEPEEVDTSRLFRWAVKGGDAEEVELLLDRGADTMVAYKDGWMPLPTAESMGYHDVVRLLLDRARVDVDSKNDDGRTALQLATERGHGDVVRPLLWNSANKDAATAQTRWSHQCQCNVDSVAFSHDLRLLASATTDGNIGLWNTAIGHCQETLEDPCQETRVKSMAFSHNSKLLASGSLGGTIRIWNTITGKCQQTLQGEMGEVNSVAFSHDSNLLASGVGKMIEIWNVAKGLRQKTFIGHMYGVIRAVALSNDAKLLASASEDGTVKLWNTTTGECQQTLKGHEHIVSSVAFSHDSKLLASGSYDHTVKIWNTTTGECQQTLGHKGWVRSLVFAHDSKLLATGSDFEVRLWDMTTGKCQETMKGYDHCALSWDSLHGTKLAATGTYRYGRYDAIKVWVVPIDILRLNIEEARI